MQHFKIVVNCGPCEQYITTCIESLLQQNYENWHACVTIDPCGDRTLRRAIEAARGDSRISITANPERMYVMHNLVHAIRRSDADPEDVIVVLDGDDWFATPDALRIINETYEIHDCWMTYGSWISNIPGQSKDEPDGLWPPYPEGTRLFRKTRWLATAVRTWKKWLWDHLDEVDLRDQEGQYFRVSEDQAVMLPMLEMAGTERARHIPQALMIYNKMNPQASGLVMVQEMRKHAVYLEMIPPRPRLDVKQYKGALAAMPANLVAAASGR